METMGYESRPEGLHVQPAPPPRRPSRAWRVFKWLMVLGLMGICIVSVLANMIFFGGLTGAQARRTQVIETHVRGPSGLTAAAKVAVLSVEDIIVGGDWSGSAGWIISQLDHAAQDDKVRVILLDVNSPGGSITACDLIHNKIKRLRERDVQVVAFTRGIAASGAYYVIAGADRIISQPTTITGSIGVIISTFNVQGLFEKIGVEPIVFKSGERKDMLSPYRPVDEDERSVLQEITDEMFERFRDVVMEGRDLSEEQMEEVSDGSVFTASQALRLGLIDQVGYFEDAVELAEHLSGPRTQVVRYSRPPSLAQVLFASTETPLSRLEKSLSVLGETLQPGFYYLWPGP